MTPAASTRTTFSQSGLSEPQTPTRTYLTGRNPLHWLWRLANLLDNNWAVRDNVLCVPSKQRPPVENRSSSHTTHTEATILMWLLLDRRSRHGSTLLTLTTDTRTNFWTHAHFPEKLPPSFKYRGIFSLSCLLPLGYTYFNSPFSCSPNSLYLFIYFSLSLSTHTLPCKCQRRYRLGHRLRLSLKTG